MDFKDWVEATITLACTAAFFILVMLIAKFYWIIPILLFFALVAWFVYGYRLSKRPKDNSPYRKGTDWFGPM